MNVKTSRQWKTYKSYLRQVITFTQMQHQEGLDEEEMEEVMHRLRLAQIRLDSLMETILQLLQAKRKSAHVDGTKRSADGKESGSGKGSQAGK